MLERRLEELFGSSEKNEKVTLEHDATEQTNENLLEVLEPSSHVNNSPYRSELNVPEFAVPVEDTPSTFASISSPRSSISSLLRIFQDVSALSDQQCLFSVTKFEAVLPENRSDTMSPLYQENNLSILNNLEQESIISNIQRPPRRDRLTPRDWQILDEPHTVPPFDKKATTSTQYTHKTQPIQVFEKFFTDYIMK